MFDAVLATIRRWRMETLKPFVPDVEGGLRLWLGDRNREVAVALARAFAGVDGVEVLVGDLVGIGCDAIVSPANSFGDMGGGIDKAIDDATRGEAQRRVMAAIREHHLGELPVGAALVVRMPTPHPRHVVAAPTMRIPGSVAGSINA